jgi:hypothetical protein
MTSLDSKQHADELVTATGGARSDGFPGPLDPTTIDRGELDDISGGIIDCIPPFPPQRPEGLPRPDGLPLPDVLPRPGRPGTIPLGPFFPSQPKPDQV